MLEIMFLLFALVFYSSKSFLLCFTGKHFGSHRRHKHHREKSNEMEYYELDEDGMSLLNKCHRKKFIYEIKNIFE